jgi:hypothetical protein
VTPLEAAKKFREMADQIERNQDAVFGGAYVIIPPSQDADSLSVLVVDNEADAAGFFCLLEWRITNITKSMDMQERMKQGFGR